VTNLGSCIEICSHSVEICLIFCIHVCDHYMNMSESNVLVCDNSVNIFLDLVTMYVAMLYIFRNLV
jgi:hypothetical protein